MGWLKSKVITWLNSPDWPMLNRRPRAGRRDMCGDAMSDSADFENPMNVTLYNAIGGRIVKFTSYDQQTDQLNEAVYIIGSDEEFEVSLGKIITMEAMKHGG